MRAFANGRGGPVARGRRMDMQAGVNGARSLSRINVVLPARRSPPADVVLGSEQHQRVSLHAIQLDDIVVDSSFHAAHGRGATLSAANCGIGLQGTGISATAESAAVTAAAAAAGPLPLRHATEGAARAGQSILRVEEGAGETPTEGELHQEFRQCECWEDVLDVVSDELGAMTPRNTVMALGQLARLSKGAGKSATPALLASPAFVSLLELLTRQLPGMTAFQTVNAFYSMAQLRVPLGKLTTLVAALDTAMARLTPSFNERDVCSSLYACAQLQLLPSPPTLEALLRRSQQLLHSSSVEAHGISMLLWSAATLGLTSMAAAAMVTEAIAQLDPARGRAFGDLTPQGVANVTWAIATMRPKELRLLQPALRFVEKRGSECKPQEVLNILWACARARYHPQAGFNAVLQYARHNISRLSAGDMSNLFHALGRFGHHPGANALDAIAPRLECLLPRMAPADAAMLFWGMGLCRAADLPVFGKLGELVLVEHWRAGRLNEPLKRQVLQGYVAARLVSSQPQLPPEMVADLKAAWQKGLALMQAGTSTSRGTAGTGTSTSTQAEATVSISHCAQQVASALRELGVAHGLGRVTGDGLVGLDIVMQAGGTRHVVLQIAEDTEYTVNTGQLLGPALWQREVIERNTPRTAAGVHQRYEVRLLAAREWRACPLDRRLQLVAELLGQLGINVAHNAVERATARKACRAVEGSGGDKHTPSRHPVRSGLKASEFDVLMAAGRPTAPPKQDSRSRRRR